MKLTPVTAKAAFSAVLAVVGVAAAIGGWAYGVLQENGQIGAGFLPFILGIALAALATVDVVQTLTRREPVNIAE